MTSVMHTSDGVLAAARIPTDCNVYMTNVFDRMDAT